MGVRTMVGVAVAAVIVAVPVLESVSQDREQGNAPPRLNAQAVDVFGPPMPAGLAAEAETVAAETVAAETATPDPIEEIAPPEAVAAEETPVVEEIAPAPVETAEAPAEEAAPAGAVRIVGSEATAQPYLVSPVRETTTVAADAAPAAPLDGVEPAAEVDTNIRTAALPEPAVAAPIPRPAHERPAAPAPVVAAELPAPTTGTYVENYAGVQQPAQHEVDYGEIFYGNADYGNGEHYAVVVPPVQHQGGYQMIDPSAYQQLPSVEVHQQRPVNYQYGFNYVWELQSDGVWQQTRRPSSSVNFGEFVQQFNTRGRFNHIGG